LIVCTEQCFASQEQMNKDLMGLLVSSCLSARSGYVHLLFCTKSLDSKFHVTISASLISEQSEASVTMSGGTDAVVDSADVAAECDH
jgi:hypothetical protein